MRELTYNLWLFEGEAVPFFGLPYSTRMTVIRLGNGDLWLHSPIAYSDALAEQLASLGTVKYLIAPNHLHHLFIEPWQNHFPAARTYATEQLVNKRRDLQFDGVLQTESTYPWSEEIGQLLFDGSRWMHECVFFHQPSRSLIVTDLIENFAEDHFSWWQLWLAKLTGIVAPNGKTPIDWRLSFYPKKARARKQLQVIKAWQPERIVLAHGLVIEQEATQFLERSFSWLD